MKILADKFLAIFFSDIYYSTIEYRNLLLRPALTIIINGGYVLLGLIALITLVSRTFKAFFYISELLMALLYLILGSFIIYFGKKVSEIFPRVSVPFYISMSTVSEIQCLHSCQNFLLPLFFILSIIIDV